MKVFCRGCFHRCHCGWSFAEILVALLLGLVCVVKKVDSYCTDPSCCLKNNNNNNNKDLIMWMIRVRSNVGTWKVLDAHQDMKVDELMKCQEFQPWEVVQPLSLDPGGKNVLQSTKSLVEQGLEHGSMIYCRVEPATGGDEQLDPNIAVTSKRSLLPPASTHQKEVVDLLDDSSDEEQVTNNRKRPAKHSFSKGSNMDDAIVLDSDDDDDNKSVNLLASSGSDEDRKTSAVSKRKDSPTRKRAKTTSSTSSSVSAASLRQQDEPPKAFQIVSYNVWFGPPDPSANQVFPEQRMTAIVKAIEQASTRNQLLCIGFQEITASLKVYLQPALAKLGYKLCMQPNVGYDFYGVGLAIPNTLQCQETKFIPFSQSTQGRGLLYVQTKHLLFGTCHLESFVDAQRYTGARQREVQIVQAASFCQRRLEQYRDLKIAMLAGDFNWDDERKRGVAPNKPLVPLLLEANPSSNWKDAGAPHDYTYDAKENPMLAGNLRRRFDRCIYLTKRTPSAQGRFGESYQMTGLQKIGKAALPGLTWNKKNPYNGTSRQVPVAPSDHFGLLVDFARNE